MDKQTIDASKLSVTELKALWLDQIIIMDRSRENIEMIKHALNNKSEEPKPTTEPEKAV